MLRSSKRLVYWKMNDTEFWLSTRFLNKTRILAVLIKEILIVGDFN